MAGICLGLPIQNNKALVEFEAGLDMTGSRVMYVLNYHFLSEGINNYSSISSTDGQFEYTYRLGLNYLINLNSRGRAPIYLQAGAGVFLKQDKILGGNQYWA